jgi:hypothetical protein
LVASVGVRDARAPLGGFFLGTWIPDLPCDVAADVPSIEPRPHELLGDLGASLPLSRETPSQILCVGHDAPASFIPVLRRAQIIVVALIEYGFVVNHLASARS